MAVKYQSEHRWPRAIKFNPHHLVLWSFLGLSQWVYVRDDMSKGLKIMSLGVIIHGMSLSVLYSKLSYTQANFIVWYRQLIWTIYKINFKCSKNIQELKTQANFRVWEIWKSVPPRCGYKKGTMTIAFIHSFHDVLPMCSVFLTCQTAAASFRVWLLWKLVISRLSFGTHFLFDVQVC